jgi:hypothetical protein
MRRRILIYLFLFALCNGQLYSSSLGKIEGIVRDSELNIPIWMASIAVSDYGGFSFSDGRFSIKVPAGTYTVKIFMVGYEMQVIDSVNISADTTIQLQFNLVYNDTLPIFECPHGKSNICEVHGTELNQSILTLRHQFASDSENLDESDAEIYDNAHKKYFPHCDIECKPNLYGRSRACKMFLCPECSAARNKWLNEHKRIKDIIQRRTKYY